jgi:hypothetical protein
VTEEGILALMRGCDDLDDLESLYEVLLPSTVEDHIQGEDDDELSLVEVMCVPEVRCAFFNNRILLEDAIGFHACLLETSRRVINGIPLGCSHPYRMTLQFPSKH